MKKFIIKIINSITLSVILYLFLVISPILGSSQINIGYDIIIPLGNKVEAFTCSAEDKFCEILGMRTGESFELFDMLPVATNYKGEAADIIIIILDLLSCLFVLGIVFAFVITFKILITSIAPWGDNAENFKMGKKKFVEVGKAFIIPVIIMVVIILISSIFDVKSPLSLDSLEPFGLTFNSGARVGGYWSTGSVNTCVKNAKGDAGKVNTCIEKEHDLCYDKVRNALSGTNQIKAIGECDYRYSVSSCYENCVIERTDLPSTKRKQMCKLDCE